jgi:hypothetical protein
MKFGVVLFHTTSSAIRAEKEATRSGLSCQMVPTPRQFSSDCGFALKFDWSDESQVKTLLASKQIGIAGLHRLE